MISSQGIHDRFGGVVPEIASRHHLERIDDVVADALAIAEVALSDVELVAVTRGPGLVAALLVGFACAKATAAACELPLAPVDHLHGHVAASFIAGSEIEPPFVSLIASGGHTFVARVDDRGPGLRAAGSDARRRRRRGVRQGRSAARASDIRAARRSSGWPARVTRRRSGSRPRRACAALTSRSPGSRRRCSTRCASWARPNDRGSAPISPPPISTRSSRRCAPGSQRALEQTGLDRLAIGGGVAANGPLRERLAGLGVEVQIPDRLLCTDNAAMIASAARYVEPLPFPDTWRSTCTRPASCPTRWRRERGRAVRTGGLLPVRRRAPAAAAASVTTIRSRSHERDIESDERAAARISGADSGRYDRWRGGVRAVRRRARVGAAAELECDADELHRRPGFRATHVRSGQAR